MAASSCPTTAEIAVAFSSFAVVGSAAASCSVGVGSVDLDSATVDSATAVYCTVAVEYGAIAFFSEAVGSAAAVFCSVGVYPVAVDLSVHWHRSVIACKFSVFQLFVVRRTPDP